MIDGQLIAHKTSDNPPIYRVSFDDGTGPVEIGSISERTSHVNPSDVYWRWGVGIMPLMDHGGRPPTGDAWSREAALAAFKAALKTWLNDHATTGRAIGITSMRRWWRADEPQTTNLSAGPHFGRRS